MTGSDALFARALAFEDAGKPDQALACYNQLLASSMDNADAWHNRGLLLARLGRFEEAEQSHRDYVRAHPGSMRARSDLADVLLALGRYADAVATMDWVLEDAPDEPTALVRKGIALSCLKAFSAAREGFARARSISPEAVAGFVRRVAPNAALDEMLSPENIFLARGYLAQGQCDWAGWNEYVAVMHDAAAHESIVVEPAIAYNALVAPLSGRERHAIARRVAARAEARVAPLPAPAPRQRQRIRVGVLSPDFRDHVVGYFLLPLFELADRSRFELFAYSLGPDDGSAIRRQLQAAAGAFRSLERLSDVDAAAAIRSDDIDLLVDVCGHMEGGRFAITLQRPARVQAAYAGFSGSLGSSRVDFAIVDRVVAPDEGEWTETLAYLPSTFYPYDFRAPAPQIALTRADYGLAEDAFVFCAFHNAHKITPDSFDLWMQVLRGVPSSVLWFRSLAEATRARLRSAAVACGVNPSRLVFAPFEPSRNPRYLARHRLGDLLLDALHHNAITNTCDALGTGLPVLTLRGTAMATRAGESLLRAAGLPELVAADREAFVQSAVRLASAGSRLPEYRDRLQRHRRTAPLFDTAGRVRELENCFEEMLQVSDQSRSML